MNVEMIATVVDFPPDGPDGIATRVVHKITLDDALIASADSIADLAHNLLARFPEPAVWVGWSQGGQVAMAAAKEAPAQVVGVVTLASFPRFLAASDWPFGMPESTFQAFVSGIQTDSFRYWKRFQMLQILGDPDEPAARDALKPWLLKGMPANAQWLAKSLAWLRDEDQRRHWAKSRVPALHIWGDRDHVVNPMIASIPLPANADTAMVPGMSHWPGPRQMVACRELVERFVQECESWGRSER